MLYFVIVESSLFRLDACPFDGNTMPVVAQLESDIEILLVSVVMVACPAAARHLSLTRSLRPVAILDSAFHLIGGCRGTPIKAFRELFYFCQVTHIFLLQSQESNATSLLNATCGTSKFSTLRGRV